MAVYQSGPSMTSAFTRVLGCKALTKNHTVSNTQMHFRLPFPERYCTLAFPGGSVVKDLPPNAEDVGLIPGSGRTLLGGNGNLTPVFLPGKLHG